VADAGVFLAFGLELKTPSVAAGGTLSYVVINTGTVPLMLGAHYELDSWAGDRWGDFPGPRWFQAWGRRLEPGDRFELSAPVPASARPGRYRLRKRLGPDRDPHPGYEWVARHPSEPIEAAAEFEVTGT
jgi:hypothetical protein